MTGAMLPVGCDTVVPVEEIAVSAGIARLKDGLCIEAWDNVHRRGSDSRQGALLLEAGTRLSPPEVAIAAERGHGARAGQRPADAGGAVHRQ